MKKSNLSTKTVLSCMIMLGSLMASTEAMAGCRWYDAPCKTREAAKKAEEAANKLKAEAERARLEAERQLAEANRIREEAERLAREQAAAQLAAAQELAKAAAAWAAARAPISPNEAANFANARLNQAGSGAQGLAVSSAQATAMGLQRVGNDVNWAFRRTTDALDAELKKLNMPIPDVAGFVQQAAGPAVNEVKSFDGYRRAMSTNFAKLDGNDIGAIWSVLRTVMEGKRPSDSQMGDYQAAFRDLFGDVSNGCAVCPRPYPSGVGVAITISTPTLTANGIPVGGSVSFNLLQSTYLVGGKPLFVAGYTINTEATTAVRPIPEVSMDVTWVAGALSTSKLPLATLSIAVSTPAVETPYGSYSGGGSVGFTTPDSVYMFLDQNERNKLLAALKNPSQGPNWVLEKINQAINDLKTMVTNPAYDAGISVGLPGTSAMKLKPDGGMVLSLGGVIASF